MVGRIWLLRISEFARLDMEVNPGMARRFHYQEQRLPKNMANFKLTHHSQSSSISSFKLPITASTTASQVFTFTLAKPGPNPGRQDAPHPHQVLADPTGKFILSPDLGADLIRIYSINTESGELTTCPSYAVAPGSGPRHMAFWSVPASYSQHVGGGSSRSKAAALTTYLYLASELTNSVSAFNVVYPATGAESNCLTLKLRQTVSNYPNGTVLPTPTPQIGEIKVKGNTVYVTNRNDDSFGVGVDSFVTYGICPNSGSITPQRFFSSEAEWPRTLVLNSKGDLAVVGGQVSSEVVVFARDVKTGQLGDVVARAVTGIRGDTSGNGGMSSAILAE